MNNKGTQALLKSDVSVVREILNDNVSVSVSTTDIEGVNRLDLPLDAVVPTLLDIPYEKADSYAKKLGFSRGSPKYKIVAVASFLFMFVQTLLVLVSVVLSKIGVAPLYNKSVLRSIKECDLMVSCSDENFKETASMLPLNVYWVFTWWSMLFERSFEILVARMFGKRVVMFPNSVGPFKTMIGRFLSRLALSNCHTVIIRDSVSYGIVKSLNVSSRKLLTSDMALLYETETGPIPEKTNRPSIGVCTGVYSHSISMQEIERYVREHAKALDAAVEKHGFGVVFLPHYISGFEYDDMAISKLVVENMKHKDHCRIINADSLEEFKRSISQMGIVVSSKMHPAVLAMSSYVPCISVAYDHKQTAFFKDLGLLDFTIPLHKVSSSELLRKIDRTWSERKRLTDLLRVRIPELQANIKKAVKMSIEPLIPKIDGCDAD
jgi:polysaccharide pyruvyl transferase WcaK-like protein